MRFILSVFLIIFLQINLVAQHITPRLICKLPDSIPESSGLLFSSANKIFTHNDSGDLPRFFAIDTLGNLLRTIYLSQATAVDYEDITADLHGNIYIGDFGNNLNNRTDLKIYKFANPSTLTGDTVLVSTIAFTYPDQQLFPPLPEEQNFDCEAFFCYNESLYLFSKNRGISEYSRIYRLPTTPGNYTAQLVDSIYTGRWVTSAALNPSCSAMVLLSETQIWLFNGFPGSGFSQLSGLRLEMDSTQKEGITFLNDTAVYISDESLLGSGGNLYYVSLGKWIPHLEKPNDFQMQILNDPIQGGFNLILSGSSSYTLEIFDLNGTQIEKAKLNSEVATYHFLGKYSGIYLIKVTSKEGKVEIRKAWSSGKVN